MSTEIRAGTADGLLAFCDFLIEKGYGGASAVNALKSAARAVFERVEGPDFGNTIVAEVDAQDYANRFAIKAKGEYKEESITAYQKRFLRVVASYREYLDSGATPKFRATPSRSNGVTNSKKDRDPRAAIEPSSPEPRPEGPALIEYPFPLRSGQIAILRLPQKLDRTDAQRLSSFVSTLVFEPMLELEEGASSER